ncbi:hypothetical protein Q8F55_001767 [Vanrija albida]|uniref:Major facilitator superfamily (MFS) profile domain-containing protein n=1 Tax=Vanrija albida TaxID=181172 RepID=A0ABR3Q7X7_9TREE
MPSPPPPDTPRRASNPLVAASPPRRRASGERWPYPAQPRRSQSHQRAQTQQQLWVPSGSALNPGGVEDGLYERGQYDAALGTSWSEPSSPAQRRFKPVPGEDVPPPSYAAVTRPRHLRSETTDTAATAGTSATVESFDNMRGLRNRAAWRRPTPQWVLPFVLAVTVSLGMTMAARAELYLDLACLAHPPRTSTGVVVVEALAKPWFGRDVAAARAAPADAALNTTAFISPFPGSALTPGAGEIGVVLSPGDRWFLDAQKDIYKWLHHAPSPTTPTPAPGDPLPIPSTPGDGETQPPSTPGGSETQPPPSTPTPSPSTPPFSEIDPALCKKDPGVQAAAARLLMTLTVMAGLLSAITTGFWASMSDRIGRRKILALCEFGLLLNDACFLVIATYPRIVAQFGFYVLLIGPCLDGLLGGFSTITAAINAYIADVTGTGSRAKEFGRVMAALMGGFAIGPALGSALIKATDSILSPFYISVTTHLVSTLLIRFLLPESLSSEARAVLTKRAAAAREAARQAEAAQRRWEDYGDDSDEEDVRDAAAADSSWSRISATPRRTRTARRAVGTFRRAFARVFGFLRPLSVFLPSENDDGSTNLNLTFMGVFVFFTSMLIGVMQVKMQYIFYTFGWSAGELGPYMSLVSICRIAVLLGLLPLAIKFLKPWYEAAEPAGEAAPLLPEPDADPAGKPSTSRSAALDYLLVRLAAFLEMISYIILAANTGASWQVFLLGSAATALGAPGNAAANSLALSFMPNAREVGRLFGGISVIHAIGATLLGPIIFANLFAATVETYAASVFILAAVVLALAQMVVLFVRVPKATRRAPTGV